MKNNLITNTEKLISNSSDYKRFGMVDKMKVSVIIPVYNQKEKYFKEALESVVNQTVKSYEIIVIDDGSNPPVILPDAKNIRLIKNEKNMGIGYSRQKGVEEAKGDFIAFLSSDDIWNPKFLEVMIKEAEKNPHKILYCAYYMNSEGRIDSFVPPAFDNHEDFCIACWESAYSNQMFVNFSTIFIPKEVFEKVQFENLLRFCEDLDFLLRSMKHFEYKLVNDFLLNYRAEENLTSRILDKIPEQNKKIREKCRRYWDET